MLSLASCATLKFTAVRAEGLKNVQMLLDQDPFVRLKLLPWGDTAKTKAAKGVNPSWDPKKHKSVMYLPYPGRPVPPNHPLVEVKVMDAEVTRDARLIGSTTLDLSNLIPNGDEETELELKLVDDKGKSAGTLFLLFEVVLIGTIEVTVLNATNLKNLQRFIPQDPYVQGTLLPHEDDNIQKKKTSVASGVNPVWKKKNVLEFQYSGEEDPSLLLECFDKEYTRKNRPIGSCGVDLGSKLINFQSRPNSVQEMTLELRDPAFIPAGHLHVEIRFLNSAYDETKPVVRGLPTQMSMKEMKSLDPMVELQKFMYWMQDEMDHNAPAIVVKISKATLLPKSVVGTGVYAVVAIFGLLVFVLAGPSLLTLLVGVIYPGYMSFKAIETSDKDDDTQWLTYWVCFAYAKVLQETLFRVLRHVDPTFTFLLFFAKLVFLVWLQHPSSRGALKLYKSYVAPVLRRNEAKVDASLAKVKKNVKDLDERIRLEQPASEE